MNLIDTAVTILSYFHSSFYHWRKFYFLILFFGRFQFILLTERKEISKFELSIWSRFRVKQMAPASFRCRSFFGRCIFIIKIRMLKRSRKKLAKSFSTETFINKKILLAKHRRISKNNKKIHIKTVIELKFFDVFIQLATLF